MVVVTEQGWVKRQGKVKDVASTRVRKGDRVLAVLAGSTKSTVAFFSSHGACYVTRIVDIPATTGHGTPLQTLFKMADDPRVTRVGRVLRRTSIDELPQLVNVLRGEMSLVGPRPEMNFIVDQYSPLERERLRVKPGITGWAQINGRNALTWGFGPQGSIPIHAWSLRDAEVAGSNPTVPTIETPG